MPEWKKIREFFPALENFTYLNTAAGCAMSTYAAEAGKRYFDEMHTLGDVVWPEWMKRTDRVREDVARFINSDPKEIAFLQNASLAMNYAQQLLAPGSGVLLMQEDFPSVTLPWLAAGRPVQFVSPQPDGCVPIKKLEGALNDSIRCVAVGHVNYSTGFRFNLEELSAFCRQRDLYSVVDVTQSLGAYPLDVKRSAIDCLLFSGYKWSTAGYGVGVMYIRRELLKNSSLPAVGWRSAKVPYDMLFDRLEFSDTAGALELGHPPFPGIFALGGALRLLEELGKEEIRARIEELTDYLHSRLDESGIKIRSTRDRQHRSGITMLGVESPDTVVEALKERKVFVSVRSGLIRVSVHFYNLEKDIDRFVEELRKLV